MKKDFLVVIHDVAPRHQQALVSIIDGLESRVGSRIILAVIPSPNGRCWKDSPNLIQRIIQLNGEVIQHGLRHARIQGGDLISTLCNQCDEMRSWRTREIKGFLTTGKCILEDIFACDIRAFLPPAWLWGPVNTNLILECGFRIHFGFHTLTFPQGKQRLATYSWDWGKLPFAGIVGTILGRVNSLRIGSLPVFAIHPADLERGYFTSILARLDDWLLHGFKPRTLDDVCPH